MGGPQAIAWLQTETGARVFFNTLVPFQDGLIKYGVIATSDLIADLLGEGQKVFSTLFNTASSAAFQIPLCRTPGNQCCGTVTILYGSGSGSGSDF